MSYPKRTKKKITVTREEIVDYWEGEIEINAT